MNKSNPTQENITSATDKRPGPNGEIKTFLDITKEENGWWYIEGPNGEKLTPKEVFDSYKYNPNETQEINTKIDRIKEPDYSADNVEEDISELLRFIVLWKINRSPGTDESTFTLLVDLISVNPNNKENVMKCGFLCFENLMKQRGFQVPMATTVLRFCQPSVFQIKDRRAFRLIYGWSYKKEKQETLTPTMRKRRDEGSFENMSPILWRNYAMNVKELWDDYLDYLNHLNTWCDKIDFPFMGIDKLLYQTDILVNGQIPIWD